MRSVPEDLPKNARWDRVFCMNAGIKTSLALPLKADNDIVGALYFASIRDKRCLNDKILRDLFYFGQILANILKNKKAFNTPENECIYVNQDAHKRDHKDIIGKSDIFRQVLLKAEKIAQINAVVLLTGETGTGKGVIAGLIHNTGPRRRMPIIQVNCAAFAPGLIESELFGHEKGAYTSAYSRRIGCFEKAH